MSFIGFKRIKLKIKNDPKIYVIEGKTDEGATVGAEITGIGKEALKIHGSDVVYKALQTGIGEISVNIELVDMLEQISDKILGYKTNTDGFTFIGETTAPPEVSVLLETKSFNGLTAFLGFPRGTFSKDSIKISTKKGKDEEPEMDAYTYTPVASDRDDETKGETLIKYVGSSDADKFENLVFGITTPSTLTTKK